MSDMKRREFMILLGGAAAWPLAARAQQTERIRRIGVLMPFAENDSDAQANITAFREALQTLGWTDSRNVRVDYRWGGGEAEHISTHASELVGLKPDVILVITALVLQPLLQRPAASRSSSHRLPIRSARALWRAWRAPVATSPASPLPSSRCTANRWRCSKRSRRRLLA